MARRLAVPAHAHLPTPLHRWFADVDEATARVEKWIAELGDAVFEVKRAEGMWTLRCLSEQGNYVAALVTITDMECWDGEVLVEVVRRAGDAFWLHRVIGGLFGRPHSRPIPPMTLGAAWGSPSQGSGAPAALLCEDQTVVDQAEYDEMLRRADDAEEACGILVIVSRTPEALARFRASSEWKGFIERLRRNPDALAGRVMQRLMP